MPDLSQFTPNNQNNNSGDSDQKDDRLKNKYGNWYVDHFLLYNQLQPLWNKWYRFQNPIEILADKIVPLSRKGGNNSLNARRK